MKRKTPIEITKETIGNMIRSQREYTHLSCQQVADRAGVHRITVTNCERHVYLPNRWSLSHMCVALDITPQSLLRCLADAFHAYGYESMTLDVCDALRRVF